MVELTMENLKKQDATTSQIVMQVLADDPLFTELAKREAEGIIKRDEEDAEKLQVGIDLAIKKGVVPGDIKVEPVTKIDVADKTPDDVVDVMIEKLGEAAQTGCILTLQGFSGTGKGTTVATLLQRLPNATAWSNGNIFRSLTLLAVTYAEEQKCALDEALTPDLLKTFSAMLTFDKFDGKFDVKIEGLEIKEMVSVIQNTKLKDKRISTNIPQVAEVTQGEVINFVKSALRKMTAAGTSVLLEGREQTLNYIRTPFRFELMLSDSLIIGRRRAAQKISAHALASLGQETVTPAAIREALLTSLTVLARL